MMDCAPTAIEDGACHIAFLMRNCAVWWCVLPTVLARDGLFVVLDLLHCLTIPTVGLGDGNRGSEARRGV